MVSPMPDIFEEDDVRRLFATIALLSILSGVQPAALSARIQTVPLRAPHIAWARYSNTAFGYSIFYPLDFILYASRGPESRYVEIANYDEHSVPNEQVSNPFWHGRVKMEIFAMPVTLDAGDLQDWVDQRSTVHHDDQLIEQVIESILVGDVGGIKVVNQYADHVVEVRYVHQLDFVLIISGLSTLNDDRQIIDAMLNSLVVSQIPPSEANMKASPPFDSTAIVEPSTALSPDSSILPVSSGQDYSSDQNDPWTCPNAYQKGSAPDGLRMPITGHKIISCGTGCFMHLEESYHAIDYVPEKSEDAPWWVVAVENGTIVDTGYDPDGFGYWIILRGQSGYYSTYAHLDPEWIFVGPNTPVQQGEEVEEQAREQAGRCP